LQPGETKTVTLTVPASKLAYYDVGTHGFVVEPGKYDLMAGASSSDIRSRATIQVTR
jgi:beta-glucosidase